MDLVLEFNGKPVLPPPFNIFELLYFHIRELCGKSNDMNSLKTSMLDARCIPEEITKINKPIKKDKYEK